MLAKQRPMEQSLKEKRSATQGPVYSRRFVMNHGEFAEAPEKNVLLQKIWSLRPNAVLMNTGYMAGCRLENEVKMSGQPLRACRSYYHYLCVANPIHLDTFYRLLLRIRL